MDFEALFKSLPYIFELFFPGFVFIKTYNVFHESKADSFENTAISSLAISYVINLFIELWEGILPVSDVVENIVAIVLAFISALIFVKIQTVGPLKQSLKWLGKISGSDNIWQDIFDRNKGAKIRCFSRFNNDDVTITGLVEYFEACEDGECNISLIEYTVTYKDGSTYTPNKQNDDQRMHLNTRNIHGLEVIPGKAQ